MPMVLDPDAQRVLDMIKAAGRPPFNTLSPDEARGFFAAGRTILQPDPPDVAEMRELEAPGPNGPVKLRLYRALGAAPGAALPVLIYYHGGGWVLGDLDSHDQACRAIANAAACCVIAVDYRLAPEVKFPGAISDSAAATRWILSNAAELAIDPARAAVGGDSAGGNIAAVMALMARDAYLPPIAFQLLIYPVTDMGMGHESYQRITEGYPLVASTMKWFIDHYLPSPADVADWRASPLRAAALAGAAPAMVVTCAHDPLCDEGVEYARRLDREGVPVTHLHYNDQMHGFLTMGKLIRASQSLIDTMAVALKRAWA
jgi:acetyl esterase